MRPLAFAIFLTLLLYRVAMCDDVNKDPIPDSTLSPDKRYGVSVPPSPLVPDALSKTNDIIDIQSHRSVGWINAQTAFVRMNNSKLLPAWWSADDAFLLWQVDGKWGVDEQVLVSLEGGKVQWELDITKVLERDILSRTETANPKQYLAASKSNWGDGSAFPEKFTFASVVDREDKKPLTFPVRFQVFLTSNPKSIEGVPELDSFMEASLKETGEITVTHFQLGKNKNAPWY